VLLHTAARLGQLRSMSEQSKRWQVVPVGGADRKSPADRAQEIRDMLDQAHAQQVGSGSRQQQQQQAPSQHLTAEVAARADAVFQVTAPDATEKLKGRTDVVHEAAVYAASQMEVGALYQSAKLDDVKVLGEVSRIINFGSGEVLFLFDTKKPASAFDLVTSPNALKLPDPPLSRLRSGNYLLEVSLMPKDSGAVLPGRAVLADDRGALKGAEFKSTEELERGFKHLPKMLLNAFTALWDAGVKDDSPSAHRIDSVKPGKKSAYEVTFSRKNSITGNWDRRTGAFNNFGQPVPESPKDRLRWDIRVELYVDRFVE
jgi:hypothetical protein